MKQHIYLQLFNDAEDEGWDVLGTWAQFHFQDMKSGEK